MGYAYKVHEALSNRMPAPFLEDISRWNDMTPAMSDKPYVQWQRGPLARTSVPLMKSWVDTLIVHDNVWLVLTFHGVDGVGWEAKPHEELKEYFSYMKQHDDKLWIAPFRDVTKYMRERMAAKVSSKREADNIIVNIDHSLDKSIYNYPLTVKTYVPEEWNNVSILAGDKTSTANVQHDDKGSYVVYEVVPGREAILKKA